jgi:hypothetical protein
MNKLINTLTLRLTLSLCLTLASVPYASANPANWSQTDNRCPKGTERYNRQAGTLTGSKGTFYWCYWYDGIAYNMSMRPTNVFRGFVTSRTPEDYTIEDYYKGFLYHCAQEYANGKGFCNSN